MPHLIERYGLLGGLSLYLIHWIFNVFSKFSDYNFPPIFNLYIWSNKIPEYLKPSFSEKLNFFFVNLLDVQSSGPHVPENFLTLVVLIFISHYDIKETLKWCSQFCGQAGLVGNRCTDGMLQVWVPSIPCRLQSASILRATSATHVLRPPSTMRTLTWREPWSSRSTTPSGQKR